MALFRSRRQLVRLGFWLSFSTLRFLDLAAFVYCYHEDRPIMRSWVIKEISHLFWLNIASSLLILTLLLRNLLKCCIILYFWHTKNRLTTDGPTDGQTLIKRCEDASKNCMYVQYETHTWLSFENELPCSSQARNKSILNSRNIKTRPIRPMMHPWAH